MARYSEAVLSYFFDAKHVGIIEPAADVFSVQVGQVKNGEVIEFYFKLHDQTIIMTRFKAYGSPATIAACEFVCRFLEHKTLQQARTLTANEIIDALQLSSFKIHVAALVVTAIQKL